MRIKKLLPPLFIGEVARWIRAKPGAAGSEGSCPHCYAMWDFLLFALQIAGLPPALRATPLINAGGQEKVPRFCRLGGFLIAYSLSFFRLWFR